MTIYVEYIFLNNLAVNFFVLYLTLVLKKGKKVPLRLLLSAAVGGIFSAAYPFLGEYNLYIKIPLSLVMVLIMQKPRGVKDFLFNVVLFYLTSFCLAGGVVMLASYGIFDVYSFTGEIPLFPFCVGATGCVLLLFVRVTVKMLYKARSREANVFKTKIIYNKKEWDCMGFYDSGNLLYDPVSQIPVVLMSNSLYEEITEGRRINFSRELTIKTVSGEKRIRTFPLKVRVAFSDRRIEEFYVRAGGVDLKNKDYQIILHSDMIGG